MEVESAKQFAEMAAQLFFEGELSAVGQEIGLEELDEFEVEVHERNSQGISQPITSIYSKLDGVVGWRASVDVYNEHARNIEVYSSHFGIGANGRVGRGVP